MKHIVVSILGCFVILCTAVAYGGESKDKTCSAGWLRRAKLQLQVDIAQAWDIYQLKTEQLQREEYSIEWDYEGGRTTIAEYTRQRHALNKANYDAEVQRINDIETARLRELAIERKCSVRVVH